MLFVRQLSVFSSFVCVLLGIRACGYYRWCILHIRPSGRAFYQLFRGIGRVAGYGYSLDGNADVVQIYCMQ
jgi:hypothetical protein